MKRILPHLIFAVALAMVARSMLFPKVATGEFDFSAFSRIPVLEGGRVKPMDTVARTGLLVIRGKQNVWVPDDNPAPATGFKGVLESIGLKLPSGHSVGPDHWLADVVFDPAAADRHPVFAVSNQEVLGIFGFPQADKRYCTFEELRPYLPKLSEEFKRASKAKSEERTPFDSAVYNLGNSLILYDQLKNSVFIQGSAQVTKGIDEFAGLMRAGAAANKGEGPALSAEQTNLLRSDLAMFKEQNGNSRLRVVAPANGQVEDWQTTGGALADFSVTAGLPESVTAFAAMGDAYRARDAAAFAREAEKYVTSVAKAHPEWNLKTSFEMRFNQMEPFYQGMILYIGAFLLAVASWMFLPRELWKAAYMVLILAFLVQSFGLVSRMWLQGRPPVTNLYSSALLVGWGAVFLAIFLEWFFRYGVALATAAVVGFVSLIIAHHLGTSGDTMEMMQAVLDNNIWLATHVVVITLGYSAMFLAGILGVAYVLLGVFTRKLTKEVARTLSGMIYGVVCFATLFSFVGTVLGGIWGDQSWGRFWGWDPKENGALLIVLWCAIILHARLGGIIRQRGMAAAVIFGNAITAFSWFGVNMLNVGLHSYGFMEKAFPWLIGFVAGQVALVLLAQVPLEKWRSFAAREAQAGRNF